MGSHDLAGVSTGAPGAPEAVESPDSGRSVLDRLGTWPAGDWQRCSWPRISRSTRLRDTRIPRRRRVACTRGLP
ncbi:hypothetical protein SAMN05216188_14113 [Lentzea xinjiangensis]|uniref:Uncharacterized protein n=1 Tax=Lentzea xinjiangensis TaxID=402600 RepID=A0A1H9WTM6_9PSEU|nr:hypothetical protein [Lentzea xinjiangensis]SES36723.1 hypothetical protein SAMN05216188_14113 [Lentzea xinjiangensis]